MDNNTKKVLELMEKKINRGGFKYNSRDELHERE